MTTKLQAIQDEIALFSVSHGYEQREMLKILTILAELTAEVQRVDAELGRVRTVTINSLVVNP